MRRHRIPRCLQVSTDEVYGDGITGECLESDALCPRSPYSASKAGGDMQALAYWATFQTPVLVTRGSNTYGPYQHPEAHTLFITNLIEGESVSLYGDGLQIRDWLRLEDRARHFARTAVWQTW